MRPDFSVILLTTLIGAGQGLFIAVLAAQFYAVAGLLPGQGPGYYVVSSLLALVLTGAGLVASFFHLGRPERGWRAIAQWRTSWLSREVIVLPAFMLLVFAYGVAHWSDSTAPLVTLPGRFSIDATLALGAAGVAVAVLLYGCTGMIYACLPFLREWHSPLTVLNFTLLGLASGCTLASAFASVAAPELVPFFGVWAVVLTVLGLIGRLASLRRNARLRPKSTMQTAIGVKHPRIVQRSAGFMGGSFNTREFFHRRPAAWLRLVRRGFLWAAFVLPAALLALVLGGGPQPLLAVAFVVQFAGLVAERWYFFAEANHPQNLYYQAIT